MNLPVIPSDQPSTPIILDDDDDADMSDEFNWPGNSTDLSALPNELIERIFWHVAPRGGRKAGNLRLLSKQFERMADRVVFSSLHLPTDQKLRDTLLATLAMNLQHICSYVQSIRWDIAEDDVFAHAMTTIVKLPRLRGLSLIAQRKRPNDSTDLPPVPESIISHLSKFPKLTKIKFQGLEITERRSIRAWARSVKSVTLIDCEGSSRPFFGHLDVLKAKVKLPIYEEASVQSFRSHAILRGLLPGVKHLTLGWALITPRPTSTIYDLNPVIFPLCSFRLMETDRLFGSSPPFGEAPRCMLDMLNFLGKSQMTALELPTYGDFVFDPLWSELRLPNLSCLVLANKPLRGDMNPGPDLFGSETYGSLFKFLSRECLPALDTLVLRGWLDVTGPETFARKTVPELAQHHVYFHGLLGFLDGSSISNVVLQYSEGHEKGKVQTVFEREDRGGRWTAGTLAQEDSGRLAELFRGK